MPKNSPVSRTITSEDGQDIMLAPTGEKRMILNVKRELFCKLYASDREFFGNGVESYAEAYGFDLSNPAKYRAAAAGATRLLKDVNTLSRIHELLENVTLNDEWVDKQLGFVITQHADMASKMAGIREYNKLKGRIIDKSIKLTGKVPQPLLGGDTRKKVDIPVQDDDMQEDESNDEQVMDEKTTVVKHA